MKNLIYKMISQYKSFDKEDLYQVAMIGLMKAKRIIKIVKIQNSQLMPIIIF